MNEDKSNRIKNKGGRLEIIQSVALPILSQ